MKIHIIIASLIMGLLVFSCQNPLQGTIKSSETARSVPSGGQSINLKANINNSFVSADQNLTNTPLVANRATASGWETFELVDAGNGLIALKASNGMYVSADLNVAANAPLLANRATIGTWETFQLIDLGSGQVNLKAMATGKFVCADQNLGSNLVADRDTAGGWESFTWTAIGNPSPAPSTSPTPSTSPGPNPDLGPNVLIFDPSMSTSSIQSQVNSVYDIQHYNQFGADRYALLFKPGSYNVDVPVGFYTQVLGLGQSPDQVTITGNLHSDAYLDNNNATCNFWRDVENLSVAPSGGTMQWAVAQATPFRRMHVKGNLTLSQNGGWSSGGFISDSKIDGNVNSGTQQQWISRSSQWGSWTGSNWNMVFVGIVNPPSGTWPNPPYTTISQVPIVREKPFLYIDTNGNYNVFAPALRTNSQGATWTSGASAGTVMPISQFYIAKANSDNAATINAALSQGKNLLFTPGIYYLNDTIRITRANTLVLGIGLATLQPSNGVNAMSVADVDGVVIAGLLFDAGATNSQILLEVGPTGSAADHSANPVSLHDLFFRVGGAAAGKASVSLKINSNNVIGDHFWIWRADHGTGVSWTANPAANGLTVNGNNVTIYGLFVEHYQQFQTIWNGNGGRTYFYQSEIPYDVPNQSGWMSASGVNGYASYKVANSVTSHEAWGLGVYSVFTNGGIYLSRAIEVPTNANVKFHDMVTVCLGGNGGISNVINNSGGSTAPNVGAVPKLTSYP